MSEQQSELQQRLENIERLVDRLKSVIVLQSQAIKIAHRLWTRHNNPPCFCQDHLDFKKIMTTKMEVPVEKTDFTKTNSPGHSALSPNTVAPRKDATGATP